MAEAEDVITDFARHATAFAHARWRRHRPLPAGERTWGLVDLAPRIDLLLAAVFGRSLPIRMAQPPVRGNWLARALDRRLGPRVAVAVPATDGQQLWLPGDIGVTDLTLAAESYRLMALQQAMRAQRGSAGIWAQAQSALEQDLVLLIEADAADADLVRTLPGLAQPLGKWRAAALAARPPLARFPLAHQMLERALRERLARPPAFAAQVPTGEALARARDWLRQHLANEAQPAALSKARMPATWAQVSLCKDAWTGELHAPGAQPATQQLAADEIAMPPAPPPRSARLSRPPKRREAPGDEDDALPGAWMAQPSRPHEMAADPMGLQRPTDRDTETAAEDFAEDVSGLPEARQIATPDSAKEILLSDDAPDALAHRAQAPPAAEGSPPDVVFDYPEWDFRIGAYRRPGARVHVVPAFAGDPAWVAATLLHHRGVLTAVRRGFEILKADRIALRRQLDGDDMDLEALVDARADYAAGLSMAQAVYRATRPARRSLAITLLVDISGSTDSWVGSDRRIIDVEREALLLVCLALEGLREPYSVMGFSGRGARGVEVRAVKRFEEAYGEQIALRIAALEPEHYTRAGAALRHAAADLMQRPARHRLLLLLSDGKPNDEDHYEGRYGVEDLRQAVVEASWQGISPFCLTIDRAAASYLPRIFGAHHYALLRQAERLPTALLGWVRRLVLH